jgi:hypothetical protein
MFLIGIILLTRHFPNALSAPSEGRATEPLGTLFRQERKQPATRFPLWYVPARLLERRAVSA